MSRLGRLYRSETEIDFVAQRRRWFLLSAALLVVSLVSLVGRHGFGELGLNLSLDFRGGVSVVVDNPAGSDVSDIRSALVDAGITDSRIEMLDDGASARVRTGFADEDVQTELVRAVAEVTGVTIEETSVEAVGPTFGAEITRRAVIALAVFLGAVMLFIAWRFEWKMAMGAIAALFHDLIITAGVYSVTGFEVTPSTVVAVLTILGYSLYDTVVVYDKIEETVEDAEGSLTYTDVVNRSMNLVLVRSINTSLTSLLPVGSLLFLGSVLLGAGSLTDFALALFVGIAAGTYSSIFVASPLLAVWKETEEEWQAIRDRIEGRPRAKAAASTPTKPKRSPTLEGGTFDSRPPISSGASPRPPKKRRRK